MRGKTSRKRMILRRVKTIRRRVRVDSQKIRKKVLDSLQDVFDLAVSLARGEVKTQTANGEKVVVTIKQRQLWARVAAYTAQVMNSIAEGFDERELDVYLNELERLVDEAKAKRKAKRTKKRASKTGSAKASKR